MIIRKKGWGMFKRQRDPLDSTFTGAPRPILSSMINGRSPGLYVLFHSNLPRLNPVV
jgi:hypothetical protein